jgi:hypothetical protein
MGHQWETVGNFTFLRPAAPCEWVLERDLPACIFSERIKMRYRYRMQQINRAPTDV